MCAITTVRDVEMLDRAGGARALYRARTARTRGARARSWHRVGRSGGAVLAELRTQTLRIARAQLRQTQRQRPTNRPTRSDRQCAGPTDQHRDDDHPSNKTDTHKHNMSRHIFSIRFC